MKVFIWCFTLVVVITANTLMGETLGFRFGWLITLPVIYFIARSLCKKWDLFKINKGAQEKGCSPFELIKPDLTPDLLETCEALRGKHAELSVLLKKGVKKHELSRAYADILLDEYLKNGVGAEVTHAPEEKSAEDTPVCLHCGERLMPESLFCKYCGKAVAPKSEEEEA